METVENNILKRRNYSLLIDPLNCHSNSFCVANRPLCKLETVTYRFVVCLFSSRQFRCSVVCYGIPQFAKQNINVTRKVNSSHLIVSYNVQFSVIFNMITKQVSILPLNLMTKY